MTISQSRRQKEKGRRQQSAFAFCLLPSAFLSLLIGALALRPALAQEEADGAQAAADLELISALERVVSRAIARAERSVVSIARRKRPPTQPYPADSHPGRAAPWENSNPSDANFIPNEFATGVVIDSSGLVLTTSHVLGQEPRDNEFFVRTIGRKQFEMKVKASDGTSDLAVLELAHPDLRRAGDFVPIEFRDASALKKGQIVISLGNPYGIARDGQASASWGIVANLSRKAVSAAEDDTHKTLHDFGTLIQTDAKLNLGTSGGALVNVRGEMVGLTTSLAATSGFEQPAGYAIPIDNAFLRIIQTLKEGREVEYGLLGLNFSHSTLERDRLYRGVQGAVVDRVISGGPASKAELRPNDVITHVDGKPVYDFDGLRLQVSRLPPGTTVTLRVVRQNNAFQRRVVLAKFPVSLPQTVTVKPTGWRGALIDYRTPSRPEAGPFQLVPIVEEVATPCVSVREIAEGSPAWEAGLRKGTLISHVGTTPVETPAEFQKAVASQVGAVTLRLLTSDTSKQTVVVPAE
jgi:serine protease Do